MRGDPTKKRFQEGVVYKCQGGHSIAICIEADEDSSNGGSDEHFRSKVENGYIDDRTIKREGGNTASCDIKKDWLTVPDHLEAMWLEMNIYDSTLE